MVLICFYSYKYIYCNDTCKWDGNIAPSGLSQQIKLVNNNNNNFIYPQILVYIFFFFLRDIIKSGALAPWNN